MVGMEIEIGNLETFEPGWFEALKSLAIQKVSEATGEPCRLTTSLGCNDDEALHILTESGRLFHVCYSDILNVFAIEEVRCPQCGQWITVDMIEEHEEFCEEEVI